MLIYLCYSIGNFIYFKLFLSYSIEAVAYIFGLVVIIMSDTYDPIPNSIIKPHNADGTMFKHGRVSCCQAWYVVSFVTVILIN